ncbi:GNAT family N-acetyltransferase [Rhizocola hellebori]|uniref:GNAT family N-acetyltransferase n=1 Tax=Rhizocola hellebori TaxID=1392758 RepID=UPI001EF2C988|nr:GNAT family N-acetyltransferase [Rhizocola hellebori]
MREWTASDDDIARRFDTYRRVEVVKWLGNATPLADLDQAMAGQARAEATYAKHQGRYGVWAVQIRDSGIVAGSVLLVPMPEPSDGSPGGGEVEIGWHLHPDSWGRGYATEAAKAVLDYGFGLGLPEILAIAKPDNAPSIAVMRRIGMRHFGRTSRWYGMEAELFRAHAGTAADAL